MHETGAPQFYTEYRNKAIGNALRDVDLCVNDDSLNNILTGESTSQEACDILEPAKGPETVITSTGKSHETGSTNIRGTPDTSSTNSRTQHNIEEQIIRGVTKDLDNSTQNIVSGPSYREEFFANVKKMCDEDNELAVAGPSPYTLALHRSETWPNPKGLPGELATIYDIVRKSGLPNALGARQTLPSNLNLAQWCEVLDLIPNLPSY